MDDERDVSDLMRETVKPSEYFVYPEHLEKSEAIEIIRRSCESANSMKEHYSNYLSIEEMLEGGVPPTAVMIMLDALGNVFKWLQKLFFLVAFYMGLLFALLFIVFTGGKRRNALYFWLYAEFPENLTILIGVPLLVLYIVGVCVSLKKNLDNFREARKVVTIDRPRWEADMQSEKKKADDLYKYISNMEALGGIPVQRWMECHRIWGYFAEGSAETLKEALELLRKERRAEEFGKTDTILEKKLQLKSIELDLRRDK